MTFTEFTGALDEAAPGGQFVPFSGELDSNGAEDVDYDALGNQTGAAPAPAAPGGRIAEEAGNLRDTFFTGVDQTIAAGKTLNLAAQQRQLQQAQDKLTALEASGQGAGPEAQGLRKTVDFYAKRLPGMVGGAVEAQADAQRGAAMTTRPAVKKMAAAKTFGDAWDAFTESPYDVIAGVTAQSLPAMLPALVAGVVAGPAAGAAAMGLSSATVEAGSSLADFAREQGVDVTDRQAVQAFFSDRQQLAAALEYAGKRAGIIGTLDAVSGGVAGKTLAPPLKSVIARQAVNLPAQMGVQAGLGAAGEAGGQLVTKGEITEPGQVLMEAVGELGGAPAEVAAFGRDAARARVQPQEAAATVLQAPTVDAAIEAATAALAPAATSTSPAVQAVDNIGRILGQESTDAAAPTATAAATPDEQPAAPDVAQAPAGPAAAQPEPAAAAVEAAAPAVVPAAPSAGPRVVVNPSGTVTITGNLGAIEKLLKAHGVTRMLPAPNGVIVGKSDAQAAKAAMAPFVPPEQLQPIAVQPVAAAAPAVVPQQPAPPAGTAPAEVQPEPMVSQGATGKAPAGGKNARAQVHQANPFRAFLGQHGISLDLANEFAPGPKERRAAMVRGYGPIFRRSGKQLDALAQAAVEDGFLATADPERLYEMVAAAMRGERIIQQFRPEAVEREMQGRMERQRQLDEEDAIAALQGLEDNELSQVEAPALDAPSNITDAEAMRLLGFTEQEISDASAQRTEAPPADGPRGGGAGQAAASPAQGTDRRREGEARGAGEGLSDGVFELGDAQQPDRLTRVGAREERPDTPAAGDRAAGSRSSRVDVVPDARRPDASGGDQPSRAGAPAFQTDAGLTSPTPEEVVAQQERRQQGERADTQRRSDDAARTSADAQRADFTLTGSDRTADANPAQQDLLAQPAADKPATDRDSQRQLIELRKRKSVLESLLKCLG